MFRKIMLVFSVIGFFAGLGIFMYPHISSYLITRDVKSNLTEFETHKKEVDHEDALYTKMKQYNENLIKKGQMQVNDAWKNNQESFDFNGNTAVATIKIPQMNLEMPIYLGATKENMAKGIAWLANTSLPIGGNDSNCVLAGHRGYRGAPFFVNIEDLVIGDEVIISNYWQELIYRVTEIKILLPSDSDQVLIQPGKDMVTLITCHPYRDNYQRYVVYCTRENQVDVNEIVVNQPIKKSSKNDILIEKRLPFITLAILGIAILIIGLIKKQRKKSHGNNQK